jgi:hypothetical protein
MASPLQREGHRLPVVYSPKIELQAFAQLKGRADARVLPYQYAIRIADPNAVTNAKANAVANAGIKPDAIGVSNWMLTRYQTGW